MPTIADLLGPAERDRLAALADPAGMTHLAGIAAATAEESTGLGRTAWLAAAVALGTSHDVAEARDALTAVLGPGRLLTVALACLGALCGDDDTTTEESRTP